MSYQELLAEQTIAISISESCDMAALGLSEMHLRDAMTEIARHLLALGARLTYGGDLRQQGFSDLLFELVTRHRRDANRGDNRVGVTNYLAWPVHIQKSIADLKTEQADLEGSAELVCLQIDGTPLSAEERGALASKQPTEAEWAAGLTSMRMAMLMATSARIVLGGRVRYYKGSTPGIAEEALLSLRDRQPIFLVGGFGGCTRDIAETMGLIPFRTTSPKVWPSRSEFAIFTAADLNNGLSDEDNATLAHTPHVDQVATLILRGLINLAKASQ